MTKIPSPEELDVPGSVYMIMNDACDTYVGSSRDIARRLKEHNSGKGEQLIKSNKKAKADLFTVYKV